MKKPLLQGAACLIGLLLLGSCYFTIEDDDGAGGPIISEPYYSYYEPVYMTREELKESIGTEAPRELGNVGKIWRSNNMLYINERYEGIHIIDNTNPANPQPVGFITIPGNIDMAAKGHMLYADSGPDLVAIDISNPENIRVADRSENTFLTSIITDPSGWQYLVNQGEDKFIVGFKIREE